MEYFAGDGEIAVRLLVSNRRDAPALAIAEECGVEKLVIDRRLFYETENLLDILAERQIDYIVLAGFLWLVPPYLVRAYAGRMANIHPALLPKYGGKGMYGMKVHEAVKAAGDAETGITIHLVNERYDEGDVVFQARCRVTPEDSPESIARKVQQLEHQYFAPVVKKLLKGEKFSKN